MVKPPGVPLEPRPRGFLTFEEPPTVMLEDADGGAGQTRAQHQRGVIQLIAQYETPLRRIGKTQRRLMLSALTQRSSATISSLQWRWQPRGRISQATGAVEQPL